MAQTISRVRIPQITSLETAIRLYYERIELSGADIQELFGRLAHATVTRLKNLARAKMAENDRPIWNARNVNTEDAYAAWGLDISDLEARYKRLCAMSRARGKEESQ